MKESFKGAESLMNYRIVSHDTVLGVGDMTFKLTKGEKVEVYEKDKYGRVRVRFHKQGSKNFAEFLTEYEEVLMSGVMLDRITNKVKDVHWATYKDHIPVPVCGDKSEIGFITQNVQNVTCNYCISALKESEGL